MIYLDYSANTPADERVLARFCAVERRCPGNANSHHQAGLDAKAEIDHATQTIARLLRVQPAEIIYTSGASESNNFALKGLARLSRHVGKHIISTPLEHSSVSGTLTALQEQGYEIDLVDIRRDGTIDLEHLKELLRPDTIAVAVTLVDSELGVVQPVKEISEILQAWPNCHLHVDATQAVGKIPVSFEGVDTMSLTAHKFYGLNGIGLLIKRRNLALEPLIHGGESTTIYRSGTPTVALASSLACALDLAVNDLPGRVDHVAKLNAELRATLSTYPLVRINSPEHASQTGKGTDDGLMRLKTHMVDYYRREGHGADGWVLKGDVRHFFASIDHRKLKRKLKAVLDKRGVDPRVYELLCIYIDVMEDGLPLGYQTSQLFALMFLDEFDHIIKEKYRIKYYGRYMDDFYIICSDKKKLQCILRDVRALMDSYGLELNQKTAIFPLRNGIDFLGFHSYLTDTGAVIQKLRRDSSKRMKNKIRYWETAYPAGEVTKQEILRSFDAWDAHAAHGDTYSLRRKYADRLEKLLDCKIPIHRKINSNKLARDRRRARQCRCIYKKQHKALSLSVSQNTRPAEIMPWA